MPNRSQSIILAGAAAGVAAVLTGLIPAFGDCLACIILIAAGMLAVWHYTDRHHVTVTGGQGLLLGALAGLIAGGVQTMVAALFTRIGVTPGWQEELRRGFEESGMDPTQIEQIQQMLSSPAAYVGILVFGLFVTAVAGGIGGAIGAAAFKRGDEALEDRRTPSAE